jgi:hypothetical protein
VNAEPVVSTFICPHCTREAALVLPVEPLFTLDAAQWLIPMLSRGQLYTALWRHRGKLSAPVYQRDETGRRYRLVSASDIRRLRELVLVPWSNSAGSRKPGGLVDTG